MHKTSACVHRPGKVYNMHYVRVPTQVNEAKETEVAININRNQYRNVAARGAMLFFLLNSLNKIHAFYQFSLNAFVSVFSRGLDLAPGGRKKPQRVRVGRRARA